MSAEEENAGDKPHDPTPKRLEDARKKGQIPRSQDLNASAAYLGLLVALLLFGQGSVEKLGTAAKIFLDQPDRLASVFFGGATAPTGGLFVALMIGLAPWFLLPILGVIISITIQRSFLITGQNLAPKLSRISPIATAKNKFGRTGLFEFSKSTLKLVLVSVVLGFVLAHEADALLGLLHLTPGLIGAELGRLIAQFLLVIVILTMAISTLDYSWQYFEHMRRNRMSQKELRDEVKESDGDPHFKGERRRRAVDIATNKMLTEVPKADVIIVNPTHYAVALKWSRKKGVAPVCVAKGVDEIAARIREAAMEAGVPIHRDPPTARALHATVEIDQEIHPNHYRAVAAAIRFAERMRTKAKGR